MTPMTTPLTEAGLRVLDALIKAEVLSGDPKKPIYPWLVPALNTAAQILLPPDGGGGLREATWHGKDSQPEVGRKFIALWDDGSGAALLYRHDEGLIDSDGDDYSELSANVDRWAYLPSDIEFRCELVSNDGEPPMHLPVFTLAPKTSVPGNDAGMREAPENADLAMYWQKKWHKLMGAYDAMASIVRGETVSLPVADYKTLVTALEADDTFVKCDICGAWLTSEENSHGADINACWARAVEGGEPGTCRSYRAPKLSPPTGSAGDDETGVREAETDALVLRFADVLKGKLRASEAKYGWQNGWLKPDWQADCQRDLARHVAKGDPLDVAAYAAFCWHHGWPTAPQPPKAETPAGVGEDDYEAAWNKYRWMGGPGYTDSSAATAFLEGWNAALSLAPAARAGDGVALADALADLREASDAATPGEWIILSGVITPKDDDSIGAAVAGSVGNPGKWSANRAFIIKAVKFARDTLASASAADRGTA